MRFIFSSLFRHPSIHEVRHERIVKLINSHRDAVQGARENTLNAMSELAADLRRLSSITERIPEVK